MVDDVLLGTMIGICSYTNDAEKALNLFEQMKKLPEIRMTCNHYNALLKALSS